MDIVNSVLEQDDAAADDQVAGVGGKVQHKPSAAAACPPACLLPIYQATTSSITPRLTCPWLFTPRLASPAHLEQADSLTPSPLHTPVR